MGACDWGGGGHRYMVVLLLGAPRGPVATAIHSLPRLPCRTSPGVLARGMGQRRGLRTGAEGTSAMGRGRPGPSVPRMQACGIVWAFQPQAA